VGSRPNQWHKWLPLAEYWYNTSLHSSLGTSPFEVLYGRSPRSLGVSASDAIPHVDLHEWLSHRQLMTQTVCQHLLRAQQRMKSQAEKNRIDRVYSVGDMVYLKLHPYVQSSVTARANHKLSFKYFGPYRILQQIGRVAYKLELPPSSSIHPIFLVSQLKPSVKSANLVSQSLPRVHVDVQVPVLVLARRSVSRGGHHVAQVKVRWSNCDEALDTWEDEVALRQQFPTAAAWGQPPSLGEGNVNIANEAHTEEQGTKTEAEGGKSCRARRPNSRVVGRDWIN
jgi:hypothetical protein